jgi:hypothetical protein
MTALYAAAYGIAFVTNTSHPSPFNPVDALE